MKTSVTRVFTFRVVLKRVNEIRVLGESNENIQIQIVPSYCETIAIEIFFNMECVLDKVNKNILSKVSFKVGISQLLV